MATTPDSSASEGAPAMAHEAEVEQHEHEVEEREAYEFWGFMFKSDKTGTDKLKMLLRALKDVMNERYEPSDNNPDLTPTQLAHFYRELHGNYDQLFLGTPSDSIAFIYKSLGCLHSLQPLPHSTAFTEPTVPALKTEGWIMWQTIQVLLGPDEHSSFLIEAVQKWDVKDPLTGEMLPKLLPRRCFPEKPDKHMVAWYEGVSERLRKEAEEEERKREIEAQQAETPRIRSPTRHSYSDEEGSLDSRGPALAYFRNPLYRHVDGRPTIVRNSSRRPNLSPRPSMMDKGKGAASSVGRVLKNIGSPSLFTNDHRASSKSRERHRDHRRRSLPENRYYEDQSPAPPAGHDMKVSPHHHRRHRSGQQERPTVVEGEPVFNVDEAEPISIQTPPPRQSGYGLGEEIPRPKSHEPTPSQKEYPDYFHGYDDTSRRNSTQAETPPAPNGMGAGFGPSASPLFASHVAKQPQPPPPRSGPPPMDPYANLPRKSPSMRRAQDRPYSRSPDPHSRPRDEHDRHRFSSHDRHPRFESPDPRHDDRSPPPGRMSPPRSRPHRRERSRDRDHGPPDDKRRSHGGGRPRSHSHRASGSDVSGPEGRDPEREKEGGRRKQTRFATPGSGVDGRRYPQY